MIKKLVFVLVATVLAASLSFAQTTNFRDFAKKYSSHTNVVHVELPGWIVRLGNHFIDEKDLEEVDIKRLIKGVHHLNLVVFDETSESPEKEDISALLEGARQAHFEDLIFVKDGKSRVNILIQESKDIIHSLLIVVTDNTKHNKSSMFLNLKGHFSMADINKMIKSADNKKSDTTKTCATEEE